MAASRLEGTYFFNRKKYLRFLPNKGTKIMLTEIYQTIYQPQSLFAGLSLCKLQIISFSRVCLFVFMIHERCKYRQIKDFTILLFVFL